MTGFLNSQHCFLANVYGSVRHTDVRVQGKRGRTYKGSTTVDRTHRKLRVRALQHVHICCSATTCRIYITDDRKKHTDTSSEKVRTPRPVITINHITRIKLELSSLFTRVDSTREVRGWVIYYVLCSEQLLRSCKRGPESVQVPTDNVPGESLNNRSKDRSTVG